MYLFASARTSSAVQTTSLPLSALKVTFLQMLCLVSQVEAEGGEGGVL